MSDPNMARPDAQPAAQSTEENLLDRVLTRSQMPRDRAEELWRAVVKEALKGTYRWDKDVTRTINGLIKRIDASVSTQLAAIMHHPAFQQIESTWRGLRYLVMNSETGENLKIRVLNVSKKELSKDLSKALEFDQSQLFKKLYESEFGTPGGTPYGALIGDYYFGKHPEDIELLTKVSNVAATAFCPFVSAAAPDLLGLASFTDLAKPRDLAKVFQSAEYTQWRSYRESEDARFASLVLPRVLARLPYGANTNPVDDFDFEEVALDETGKPKSVPHGDYCWMNAAYVYGHRLTDAFAQYGFCCRVRGAEGGGKVEGLPTHVFTSDNGDLDTKCPSELAITDRREAELSSLGFLPLLHYQKTDYAVFFGAQTTQKPKKYDDDDATANAALSARLPYIMAMSRITHYLKVLARDKIGSFMEAEDCQDWLERWIANYVSADAKPSDEMKARYPLREAKIEVREDPAAPGSYLVTAWLRPWLMIEELTTSMRLVARVPKKA